MKFEKLDRVIKELENITGDKWKIEATSLTNNEYLTRIENSMFLLIECGLSDFGGLPQNTDLSLDDYKHYIKTSGRNLKYVELVQEGILYHHNKKTNKTYFEYLIKRKFPFDTKLDDGSLLIDNLENFTWQYEWKERHSFGGYHYTPSGAYVFITAEPSKKLLEYMDSRPITINELIPVTHHTDVFVELERLSKQVISNINSTTPPQPGSDE